MSADVETVREALERLRGILRVHVLPADKALNRLEGRVAEAEKASAAYADARERLRLLSVSRPPDSENRDTYADGYTSGLVEALWIVRRPEFALPHSPEAATAGEPEEEAVEGDMCPATLRACDVPQYCTDNRYGCARLRASGTDAAPSGAAP